MSRSANSNVPAEQPFRLHDWHVDPASREVTGNGAKRRLSPKAMAVLQHLVGANGHVVSRDDLMDAAWPAVTVGEESLTHVISELRRAFRDPANDARIIKTVHKSGYRLLVLPTPGSEAPVQVSPIVPVAPNADDFDLEAYMLCLEALRVIERSGADAVERSFDLCREAIGRAPNFAYAQAEYAVMAVQRRLYCDRTGPSFAAAAEAAMTATWLRPDQALCHAALGFVQSALGHHDRARRAFMTALARDKGNSEVHYLVARALFAAGDMTTAARIAERAADLAPEDYRPVYLASAAWAGVVECSRLNVAASRAHARIEQRLAVDPTEPRARNAKGSILMRLGRFDEGLAAVEEYERSGEPLEYYNVAALAWAGEVTEAIARLEALAEQGWRHPDWMNADPSLSALRRELRFRKLRNLLDVA